MKGLKGTQALSIFVLTWTIIACNGLPTTQLPVEDEPIEDMKFWYKVGQDQLQKKLSYKNNENKAKNVIIFLGDGMGMSTITAGRIFKGQSKGVSGENYKLVFENFPHTGLSKTYNVDSQITDSASSATAILSGVKIRNNMVGLDANAPYKVCDQKMNEISKLKTIANWAQESGLDTGFVTTTRLSHATPSALYAHVNDRSWECDSKVPEEYRNCIKDIPRQLIEDEPGRNFKVMMGGGGRCMCVPYVDYPSATCDRIDGQNLTRIWQNNNPNGAVVTNAQDLMSLNLDQVSKILGIFGYNHLPYQATKTAETPSLAEMTKQAIKLLSKNKNGYFLFVEGGLMDVAHHENKAKLALQELSDFDDAVETALNMSDLKETLIIVTADHSHTLTINGNSKRGSNILGHNDAPEPYDILSYALGQGFAYHRTNDSESVDGTWKRVADDPNHNTVNYTNFAGRLLRGAPHAGEDVAVYAIGPYSHLFEGTFEENYIAHAVAYAACYTGWTSHCKKEPQATESVTMLY